MVVHVIAALEQIVSHATVLICYNVQTVLEDLLLLALNV